MRKLLVFVLLTSLLSIGGCSSGGGSDTPSDTNAHPQNWFSSHAVEAIDSPGYVECKSCHGLDLSGSGDVVSCYSCHSYNTMPPFNYHPPSWADAYSDHRAFAAQNGFSSCAGCHGQDLHGRDQVPSCFSASLDGRSCHADGPGEVPHALDGSYLRGNNHGPDAKADLTTCQSCHGELGGPGSNPHFNIGFGENACEDCHGTNLAHPRAWAGPNRRFHYTAGSIQEACTLCHGENLDGAGGVGVSCLGCHDSVVDFSLDCAFCHGFPPDGSDDLYVPIPVPHYGVADVGLHVECLICHGMNESLIGSGFDPSRNYLLFDYATEVNGDHWDGNIQMNIEPQYNINNHGCDAADCHGASPNTPDFQLSGSGLPVVLKNFFESN